MFTVILGGIKTGAIAASKESLDEAIKDAQWFANEYTNKQVYVVDDNNVIHYHIKRSK